MKIIIFETKSWEKKFFNKALKGHDLKFIKEPISLENCQLAGGAEVISVFITSKVTAEILNKLPNLKLLWWDLVEPIVAFMPWGR